MVIATINRFKTETRRMNGLDEINKEPQFFKVKEFSDLKDDYSVTFQEVHGSTFRVKCPYGGVGTILYIREHLTLVKHKVPFTKKVWEYKSTPGIEVWSNDHQVFTTALERGFIASMHMPKVASRLWLQITSIHVERLFSITEESAINEGIESMGYVETTRHEHNSFKDYMSIDQNRGLYMATESFLSLWIKINGSESLQHNPWVWVVKFKVIQKPTSF